MRSPDHKGQVQDCVEFVRGGEGGQEIIRNFGEMDVIVTGGNWSGVKTRPK